ncbi:SRPBCC family protein [Nocardia jiangxiensis]|uniref:SRPBCC family protein n=1 Tax=Nocardia jiangxiensis TaxID=282685 RepID=UPI0003110025|nr:SRPBCC family protein [Nocardia jiangxiensis]
MKLENTFSIPVPISGAWNVLLDIERIAPCVPGAVLTGRKDDGYTGKIKVKLGPVGLSYTGVIKFRSTDEVAGIAVLEGGGREARGNGTAQAIITCRLVESVGGTDVFVETDLAITGKPAQFGRGALADVAGTLIGQFAANLAEEIASGNTSSEVESVALEEVPQNDSGPVGATTATPPRLPAQPIDLLEAAGVGRLTRLGPPAAITLSMLIVLLWRRRSSRRRNEIVETVSCGPQPATAKLFGGLGTVGR